MNGFPPVVRNPVLWLVFGFSILAGEGFAGGKPTVTIEDTAIEALTSKLGVAATEVRHISTEETDWGDSSLGCPTPGKMYMQVITPGHKVILEHSGTRYPIHMSKHRAFICESTF